MFKYNSEHQISISLLSNDFVQLKMFSGLPYAKATEAVFTQLAISKRRNELDAF